MKTGTNVNTKSSQKYQSWLIWKIYFRRFCWSHIIRQLWCSLPEQWKRICPTFEETHIIHHIRCIHHLVLLQWQPGFTHHYSKAREFANSDSHNVTLKWCLHTLLSYHNLFLQVWKGTALLRLSTLPDTITRRTKTGTVCTSIWTLALV